MMARLRIAATAYAMIFIGGGTAPAQDAAAVGWREFIAALKPEATAAGVRPQIYDAIFAGMGPNCKQPAVYCSGRVGEPPAAHAALRAKGLPETCFKVTQKEFLRPGEYFDAAMMARLAAHARELIAGWRAGDGSDWRRLMKIEADSGVDHRILMALWGRETDFGRFRLQHNAVQSLASMAFAGAPARKAWARTQTIAALRMVSEGHVSLADMKSSYAGATGLTQLLPTEYLERGVDGDGDGRVDVWRSAMDALATTANVLKAEGWSREQRTWGAEARLPEKGGADCTLEGPARRRTLAEWRSLGVTGGEAGRKGDSPAYIVAPAGARGPVFLATDNFEVLRRYNTSDVYAAFIGELAQRIGCAKADCGFRRAWPKKGPDDDFAFSVENLCRLQIGLQKRGFSTVPPDGLFGRGTRIGIGLYQKSRGEQPDCYPTQAIYEAVTGRAP